MRIFTADAVQQALGFLVSQTSHIESTVIEIPMPEIQYPALIPVDTSANEWAKSVTYFSIERVGQANWFHHNAKDIPLADVQREQHEVGIEMAAIGYRYTLEELGRAMMVPGTNLQAERAIAARRAYEQFVDDVALRGDEDKNFNGFIDYPGITVINLTPGGSGFPDWANKTADEILADVNGALTGMYVATNQIEIADTLLLPIAAMTLIATKRIDGTTMTVLQFLQMNNVYTMTTGRPLTIRAIRGLESAGMGGTGRMIAYRRDPSVVKIHIPMTHRFLPVWQTGPLVFDIPGIFRIGGLEIRRPGAVRYIDGLVAAAYE